MYMNMVKVGFIKIGNIGLSTIAHLLLDERADREDIEVRVVSTGAKMGEEEATFASYLMGWNPDLVVVISPNAALSGPKKAREMVEEKKKPCVIISDAPAKKAVEELKEKGFGYLIITGDPLIGARRELLDAVEMTLFNTDVLRVLSITGATRLVQEEIDAAIERIKKGEDVREKLPQIVATAEKVVERAGFSNPYAKAKAIAAYNMAEKVAEMNVKACFIMKKPEEYIPMATAAHELMREAAKLAEEARRIEKTADSLYRKPHSKSGELMEKEKLMEKPSVIQ